MVKGPEEMVSQGILYPEAQMFWVRIIPRPLLGYQKEAP